MRFAVIAIVCVFVSPHWAFAQPALERLEQQLQQAPPKPAPTPAVAREPGYLGVITDDRQDMGRGVRVVEAFAEGPGAKGGLQAGDLIKQVNNLAVHQMADLAKVIELAAVGDTATFTIDRGGEERKLVIAFGKRPPAGQRKFDAFGKIPSPTSSPPAANEPAPPSPGPAPGNSAPQQLPPPVSRVQRDHTNDGARIELLERRVAELEQRLAELEKLLRLNPAR